MVRVIGLSMANRNEYRYPGINLWTAVVVLVLIFAGVFMLTVSGYADEVDTFEIDDLYLDSIPETRWIDTPVAWVDTIDVYYETLVRTGTEYQEDGSLFVGRKLF